MYLIAGHKGRPDIVAQEGRPGQRRRLKGKRGRGTLAEEKPPVLGLPQRDGEVVIRMLPKWRRKYRADHSIMSHPSLSKALSAHNARS
jgi:hypothetical protein